MKLMDCLDVGENVIECFHWKDSFSTTLIVKSQIKNLTKTNGEDTL